MDYQAHVLTIIAIPLLGSLLIPVLGWLGLRKYSGWLAVPLIAATWITTLFLLGPGLRGETGSWAFPLFKWVNFSLRLDALSIYMSCAASFIAMLIAIYSLSYIEHDEHESEYYFIVTLFVGAMMGLVYSTNLAFLYLFWEISALACWRLIGYYRKPDYILAADKAMMITFGGAVLMLLGFGLVLTQYGSLDLSAVANQPGIATLAGKPIGAVALCLILAGVFSKSATVPLHTWLPDAGVAPSSVTSLLHAAILVKIGLYAFARMFFNGMQIPAHYWTWILGFVMASAFISACAAYMETNIKRVLAYSTVSQIGYTFLGFCAAASLGYVGALLYIFAHGLAKGGLFLCAGIVEHGVHTKDMTKMGGLIKHMPVTALAFAVCAMGIAGIPPLAGFFAKYFVISGLFQGGHPVIATLAILTAILTMLYMMKSFHMVFLGRYRGENHPHHEPNNSMVWVVALLGLLTIGVGLGLRGPWKLATKADEQRLALAEQQRQAEVQRLAELQRLAEAQRPAVTTVAR